MKEKLVKSLSRKQLVKCTTSLAEVYVGSREYLQNLLISDYSYSEIKSALNS